MSRFARLDFDDAPARPQGAAVDPVDPWPDLDEEACFRAGEEQFRLGLYAAALVFYSRVLRFNKGRVDAWVGQVRCLLCQREYREALTWSDRGLQHFRDAPDLLACKGLALVLAGKLSEGMEYLDGALEQRTAGTWPWLARGEALLAARERELNARNCFVKARELAPDDWTAELHIGIVYNMARFPEQAKPALLRALRHAEENPLVLYHLGLAEEGLGQWEAAAGCYRQALVRRRDFREAAAGLERVRRAGPLTRFWRGLGFGRR